MEKESVSSSEDQELPLLGGWLGITVGRKELESSDSDLMAGTGRKEEFLAPESRKSGYLRRLTASERLKHKLTTPCLGWSQSRTTA